jgi:hypothetical protein
VSRRLFYVAMMILGGGLAYRAFTGGGDGGDLAWGIAAVVAGGVLLLVDRKDD